MTTEMNERVYQLLNRASYQAIEGLHLRGLFSLIKGLPDNTTPQEQLVFATTALDVFIKKAAAAIALTATKNSADAVGVVEVLLTALSEGLKLDQEDREMLTAAFDASNASKLH